MKNFIRLLSIFISIRIIQSSNFRKLEVSTSRVACLNSSNVCKCPGPCMNPIKNTTFCQVKKCYLWNSNLGICQENGPKFVPALVLQAIPFTGYFGSGYGNMGRWDLFGLSSGILFGGCLFICFFSVIVVLCTNSDNENKNTMGKCCSQCLSYIWAITITVLWIKGIVDIANKDIVGPNGCKLVS